jgi:hypothetical protein
MVILGRIMKAKSLTIIFIIIFLLIIACSNKTSSNDITVDEAIKIATSFAKSNKYNTNDADVEVLKVKNGKEKGPVRLVWMVSQFPKEKMPEIIHGEFWIVFFYPKGLLENRGVLGGDFSVLVDLHSGKIVASRAGM